MILKGFQVLALAGENNVFLSKLNCLYRYEIKEEKLSKIHEFRLDVFTLISLVWKPFRRLFRRDIRCGIVWKEDNIIVVRDQQIFTIKIKTGAIISIIDLPRGSRPLNFVELESIKGFDNGLYFGEYFGNKTKESVRIFKYAETHLVEVYCFEKGLLNHIHNLVVDEKLNCVWVLGGDFGDGASIYQAFDNFKIVKCVVKGEQHYRACVGFPVKEGLLYATDSQFQQNSIRLLHEESGQWESSHIYDINGPSIFGTTIDEKYYFSTSVEAINSGGVLKRYLRNKRGPGIIKNRSEIVSGTVDQGFRTIYYNSKDILPFILFQFGNITFPSGNNLIERLVFTPVALKKNDFNTVIINI